MCIYICIYTHRYLHPHMHIYTLSHVSIGIYAHIHAYSHCHTHIHEHIISYVYQCNQIHTQINILYRHTNMCICTYICMYTCTPKALLLNTHNTWTYTQRDIKYVYVQTCPYAHIHLHAQILKHVHTCTKHGYTHRLRNMCMHIHLDTLVCSTHMELQTRECMCMWTHMCIHAHVCKYALFTHCNLLVHM